MARVSRSTSTVTLASGASGTSAPVNCLGASRVHFAISCDVTHQLTAGTVTVRMSDGKTISLTPAVFPDGTTDAATHELDAAGVIITVDLNSASNHRAVVLRPMNGTFGPYALGQLMGADYANLALTKAATVGNAVYTVVATVYFP